MKGLLVDWEKLTTVEVDYEHVERCAWLIVLGEFHMCKSCDVYPIDKSSVIKATLKHMQDSRKKLKVEEDLIKDKLIRNYSSWLDT